MPRVGRGRPPGRRMTADMLRIFLIYANVTQSERRGTARPRRIVGGTAKANIFPQGLQWWDFIIGIQSNLEIDTPESAVDEIGFLTLELCRINQGQTLFAYITCKQYILTTSYNNEPQTLRVQIPRGLIASQLLIRRGRSKSGERGSFRLAGTPPMHE